MRTRFSPPSIIVLLERVLEPRLGVGVLGNAVERLFDLVRLVLGAHRQHEDGEREDAEQSDDEHVVEEEITEEGEVANLVR